MALLVLTRSRAKPCTQMHKQWLTDMPLDVVIEIFLYLEPLDLLHLARTTKELREFLLDRRRSSILWKNAFDNVNLPPCPDHMSAPAYAHLAFVPVCHTCFCPCETVEWELRMRCCLDCFSKVTLPRALRGELYDHIDFPIAHTHLKLKDDDLGIRVSTDVILPFHSISWSDLRLAQSRKRPRELTTEEFIAQQNVYWGSIQRHAQSCRHWQYKRLEEKAAQLSRVRKQRIADIKHKLGERGWTEPLIYNTGFIRLPQVRKLEPLTPAEWAEIQPQLVSWAEEAEKALIWNRCKSIFSSVVFNITSNTPSKVRPRMIDMAMLPAVQSVFESAINSGMNHDDLKKKFHRVLPPAVKKWCTDTIAELEQFSREQLGLSSLLNPSSLPWVLFRCTKCPKSGKDSKRFGFDEALSHRHLYGPRDKADEGNVTQGTSIHDKLVMGYDTYPRNIQVLRVDVIVSRRVENLIKRMGKNPSRVSYDELHRSSVRVTCNLCRRGDANGMKFGQAFDHCLDTHLWSKETEVWTRIPAIKKL